MSKNKDGKTEIKTKRCGKKRWDLKVDSTREILKRNEKRWGAQLKRGESVPERLQRRRKKKGRRGEMQRSSKSEMLLQGNRRRCEGDVYDLRQQREGEGGASRRVRGGITSVVLCCAQERQQHIHHPDIRREHWIGFPSDAASRGGVSKVS